jgi:hypothetical protein
MGLLSLFKTSDGEVPFLQILLGLLLGIIGTFAYFKFYKPFMCGEKTIKEKDIDFIEPPVQTATNENYIPTLVEPDSLPKIPTPIQKSYEELEVINEQEENEDKDENIPYINENWENEDKIQEIQE